MRIELNLVLSLIMEAVKAETYIKGRIDRATVENGEQLAYHETAGDEVTHERKLMRGIYTSSDKLRGWLQDYLNNEGGHVGGNDFKMIVDEATDKISFELVVSERFNRSNNDALARSMSKFIEDNTLALWWGTFNEKEAAYYQGLVTEDIAGIQRLLMKTAPRVPVLSYPTKVECDVDEVSVGVGEEQVVSYRIDGDCIDDIDWLCDRPRMAECEKGDGGTFTVRGRYGGVCHVVLFSRHNSEVYKELLVSVTGNATADGGGGECNRHGHYHHHRCW